STHEATPATGTAQVQAAVSTAGQAAAPGAVNQTTAHSTAPAIASATTQAAPGLAARAADKPVTSASFGLSSIHVIVHPNDTLDAIFRRLKLSLSDLASLRDLSGLERRLNEEQTLKVSRDSSGLKADVLQNPLDARPRVVRAVINSSLFE